MVDDSKYERPVFVAYDVHSNKIRKKVYTACEDYGLVPVQYSIFFGYLVSTKKKELDRRIGLLMKDDDGNFIIIPLEKNQIKKISSKGKALGISQTPMVTFL